MILYCYDESGVYCGPVSPALSPARPFAGGEPNYLRPARSTDKAPPACAHGLVPVFNGTSWSLVTDLRGQVAYDTASGRPQVVTALGPLPAEWVETPPPSDCHVWDGASWKEDQGLLLRTLRRERNAKLAASDWTQLADAALTDGRKAAWAAYRQELRDLPANWTKDTPWPQAPEE